MKTASAESQGHDFTWRNTLPTVAPTKKDPKFGPPEWILGLLDGLLGGHLDGLFRGLLGGLHGRKAQAAQAALAAQAAHVDHAL